MHHSYQVSMDYGEAQSVTATFKQTGDRVFVAASEHPAFDQIVEALQNGEPERFIIGLFDAEQTFVDRFAQVSKTIKVDRKTNTIHYEGRTLHGSLADIVLKYFYEKHPDFTPIVMFLEKVMANPSAHSRENLFRWLAKHNFSIDHEGYLYAYKGVRKDLTSSHKGPALVNGKLMNCHIPNQPGSVISMNRKNVQWDPKNGCSTGLHAGNWSYARGFAERTLLVRINPKDVVSIPTDSGDQKMRVCKYTVVQEVQKPVEGLLLKSVK